MSEFLKLTSRYRLFLSPFIRVMIIPRLISVTIVGTIIPLSFITSLLENMVIAMTARLRIFRV